MRNDGKKHFVNEWTMHPISDAMCVLHAPHACAVSQWASKSIAIISSMNFHLISSRSSVDIISQPTFFFWRLKSTAMQWLTINNEKNNNKNIRESWMELHNSDWDHEYLEKNKKFRNATSAAMILVKSYTRDQIARACCPMSHIMHVNLPIGRQSHERKTACCTIPQPTHT